MPLSSPSRCGRADRKWGQAYLKRGFFHALGEAMPDQVLLATAYQDGDLVAGEGSPHLGRPRFHPGPCDHLIIWRAFKRLLCAPTLRKGCCWVVFACCNSTGHAPSSLLL